MPFYLVGKNDQGVLLVAGYCAAAPVQWLTHDDGFFPQVECYVGLDGSVWLVGMGQTSISRW